jgi:hypothetical protein
MLKNVSGQSIGAQMTNVSDGLPFTGVVTVYLTGDRGTQTIGSVGSGICTHEGKGFHTYAPLQAETDYSHIAWTFEGPGAITVTVQVYPSTVEASLAAIQSSLSGTTVTVTGYASIDTNGVLQLKRAETATLTFTSDSADLVPDLSAGTTKIVMGIKDTAGRVWLSIEGEVLVATGLQSVRFVLTPELSLALIKGQHNFDVLAIYGYDANLAPPYTSLKTFTSGRTTVTDVYLDPLEL